MSSFLIGRHKYGLGSLVFLNVASIVIMDICQKSKRRIVSSVMYIICDPLYENRTYETISNCEKGVKICFMSNVASRTTVLLKLFASKRCILVCQQNLVVELYYGSTTDLENEIAFPKATMKFQTVKCGSSIENLRISLNFVQV